MAAELQARRGTLSDRLLPTRLMHLEDADSIQQAVTQDKRLLFQLPWKRVALRHPQLALQLVRMALETGDSDVALGKRWALVRYAGLTELQVRCTQWIDVEASMSVTDAIAAYHCFQSLNMICYVIDAPDFACIAVAQILAFSC